MRIEKFWRKIVCHVRKDMVNIKWLRKKRERLNDRPIPFGLLSQTKKKL